MKRTSTDALLIAAGASAVAFATSAQAGAPFSRDPTFEARAQSGNLDPESKTWIIDTARRFYRTAPAISRICRQSGNCAFNQSQELLVALHGFEATRGLNPHTPLRM